MADAPDSPMSPKPRQGEDQRHRRLTVTDAFTEQTVESHPDWLELLVGDEGTCRASHGTLAAGVPRGIEESFSEKKAATLGKPITVDETGVAFTCRKGLKRESPNQDDYAVLLRHNRSVFAVFDGHGPDGHQVSNLCTRTLPTQLQKCDLGSDHAQASAVITECFVDMQKRIHEAVNVSKGTLNANTSGTTGSTVVLEHGKFWCAWVGDSRVVQGVGTSWDTMVGKDVSYDHKPELPAEKQRIVDAGGQVRKFPYDIPHRVCSKNSNFPGLAMSRSFGDFVAASLGVSHLPDVYEVPTEGVELILLCSDGVWEFISTEEAVELIRSKPLSELKEAAQELAQLSWDKWIESEGDIVDDITVIAIHVPTLLAKLKEEKDKGSDSDEDEP